VTASADDSVTHFFQRLRAGDADAAGPLWQRFFPRLTALARRTLSGQPMAVADADDAALSAFATFCRRAAGGEFSADGRDDLWKLLGVMTVRKARRQVRRERAGKRGGGRVLGEARLLRPDGSPLTLDEAAAGDLPATDFDLFSEELLAGLTAELREIAILRLLGHLNREIADRLGCTERKVERKLALIRLQWEQESD
jgi:DNA-directed RNA polymerase specialized sigma24 family protein